MAENDTGRIEDRAMNETIEAEQAEVAGDATPPRMPKLSQ